MSQKVSIKLSENMLDVIQVFILFIPIEIIQLTWFNVQTSIVFTVLFVLLFIKYTKHKFVENRSIDISLIQLVTIFAISFMLLYFSGIGGFARQTWDFFVRSPIYNDLIQKPWPLTYDLQNQSAEIQNLIGSDKVYFVYYLAFWIVPQAICKIIGLTSGYCLVQNIILFSWSLLILVVIMLNLVRFYDHCDIKQSSKIILALIMFTGFCGLDILFEFGTKEYSLEGWSSMFQYQGNTTILYWVFNQGLPLWLMMQLLINDRHVKNNVWIYSLVIWYSPWNAIGLIPIILARLFQEYEIKSIKDFGYSLIDSIKSIGILNWMFIAFEALVSCTYYMQNSHELEQCYFIFDVQNVPKDSRLYIAIGVLFTYTLFLTIEFWFMLFLMHGSKYYNIYNSSKILNYVVVIQLVLIPLYHATEPNDFCMRVSMPALFYMFIYWQVYVVNILDSNCTSKVYKVSSSKKALIIVAVALQIIGSYKIVLYHVTTIGQHQEDNQKILLVGSTFDSMRIPDKKINDIPPEDIETMQDEELTEHCNSKIELIDMQFFAHDFEDTFYYKMFSKQVE